MKYIILSLLVLVLEVQQALAQQINFPDSIYSGRHGNFHVQGVAVDQSKGFVYFSFTDRLVKTDLSGKMIGSVTGFVGHLGDLDMSQDGKVYGSLEYKNDTIGKGIQKKLGAKAVNEDGFYVAIFDGSAIIRANMNAEKEDLVRTVFIKEATDDYNAEVTVGSKTLKHRFACSGIDGIAFGPSMGASSQGKNYLYVAYGIYGDNDRTDNDQQVILKYDVTDWEKYARQLSQEKLHHSGPIKPIDKYFIRTGNSRYGIQNLAYDSHSGYLFAAVYRGSKLAFPNYDLFVIDATKKPVKDFIMSADKKLKVKMLPLLAAGEKDTVSGTRGWRFPWGSTGLWPIGDGTFYISQPAKAKDGQQEITLFRYQWLGGAKKAFELFK
ncbi:MAG TPA: hypothetical protein VF679_05120 [Pedobacter sp.]